MQLLLIQLFDNLLLLPQMQFEFAFILKFFIATDIYSAIFQCNSLPLSFERAI